MRLFPSSYKRRNPPVWLENSKLFKKLFVFRRILSSNNILRYFSSSDGFLRFLFKNQDLFDLVPSGKGFYVDVGCFHPVRQNTTFFLYQSGWTGINVDVDQIKIDAFNLRRPRDTNIACAVSNQTGMAKFWRQGLWSDLNSLTELERASKEGWLEIKVQTDTLENLIDQTPYKGREIDFLSVDVEGHELPVLQSLNFDRYRPKVLHVEVWAATLEQVLQSKSYAYITSKGYVLINWICLNLVFMREDCYSRSKYFSLIRDLNERQNGG